MYMFGSAIKRCFKLCIRNKKTTSAYTEFLIETIKVCKQMRHTLHHHGDGQNPQIFYFSWDAFVIVGIFPRHGTARKIWFFRYIIFSFPFFFLFLVIFRLCLLGTLRPNYSFALFSATRMQFSCPCTPGIPDKTVSIVFAIPGRSSKSYQHSGN